MNNILLIALSYVAANALPEQIAEGARKVGLREAREVCFYVVCDESLDNEAFIEVHENSSKPASRFATLFLSVRWSRSKGDYVIASNKFANLDSELVGKAWAAAVDGLLAGKTAYEEAVAVNEKLESLSARIRVEEASAWSHTAWFNEREDAELWATQKVGTRNVDWSVMYQTLADIAIDSTPSEACANLELPGLWRAYVSNVEKVAEVVA